MLDIYKLIDCVRARIPLWNRQSPLYTARALKKQLWREVVALTGAREDEARRKWKCLNDIYRREHNKYVVRKKEDPDAEPPQWIYYSHMEFLESHIGVRHNANNCQHDNFDTEVNHQSREDPDDHSLDSTLDLDLNNFPDVSVKMEILDDSSSYDAEFTNNPNSNNDIVKIETILPNSTDHVEEEEPAAKRTKQFANEQEDVNNGLAETNLRQAIRDRFNQVEEESASNASRNDHKNGTNVECTIEASQQVEIEYNRSNMLQQQRQQKQHLDNETNNDDLHFALSLVPTMRGLPLQRKMLLRLKIQQLLCEEVDFRLRVGNTRTNESEES